MREANISKKGPLMAWTNVQHLAARRSEIPPQRVRPSGHRPTQIFGSIRGAWQGTEPRLPSPLYRKTATFRATAVIFG
jgi:hypothetical protein